MLRSPRDRRLAPRLEFRNEVAIEVQPDGLGAWRYRVPPGGTFTGPDPATGYGQYWVPLLGEDAASGGALPPYKPGAHIDIHIPNGLVRQFSLLNPADNPETYVVGIKRDAQSRGGSRYIFDEMHVGHTVKISAPRNNFPLVENAEHVVLVAGGIGITPIWCMAQQLAAQNRSWKLYYSCRSRADMAFLDTLEKFGPLGTCTKSY